MQTKHLFLSAVLVMGVVTAKAQTGNFGIGTPAPTNKLHVKPTSVDPLRIEGVQTATDPEVLTTDANGVVHKRTVTSLITSTTNVAGYIYNGACDCNTTTTITTDIDVQTGNGTNPPFEVISATMATALNAGTCAIAIALRNPTTLNITSSTFLEIDLPSPGAYAGRLVYIHPAIPNTNWQFSSNGDFKMIVQYSGATSASASFLAGASANWQDPGSPTANAGFIGVGTAFPIAVGGLHGFPTLKLMSDGVRWIATQSATGEAADCWVYHP